MRKARVGIALVVGSALLVSSGTAQTGQRVSLQFSGLAAFLSGEEFEEIGNGVGFEAQIRYNPSAFSIGAGIQYTLHKAFDDEDKFHLRGLFVEPRYVIPTRSAAVAPYLAARISVLQEKIGFTVTEGTTDLDAKLSARGFTLNGGGGLLVRLNRSMNLDLGLTIGQTDFGNYTYKVGGEDGDLLDLGIDDPDAGKGRSIIIRVGLAIGLGK